MGRKGGGREGRRARAMGSPLDSCLVPCNIRGGPAQIQSVLGALQKGGAKLNSRSKGRSMGLNVREPGVPLDRSVGSEVSHLGFKSLGIFSCVTLGKIPSMSLSFLICHMRPIIASTSC